MLYRFLFGVCLSCLASSVYSDDEKQVEYDHNNAQNYEINGGNQAILTAEGVPEDVTSIDFYKTNNKFYKTLTYKRGEQIFTSQESDKFAEAVPSEDLRKYSNVETLTFNNIDFGTGDSVANLLELAGINALKKLENVVFVGCTNLAGHDGEGIMIRALSDVSNFNSLVISPAINEKFPTKLIQWLASERINKCNKLSVLSLLIDELDEPTSKAVAEIISAAKKNLTTLCLSVKKTSNDKALSIISNSLKGADKITYLALSFAKDIPLDDLKAFFANINNGENHIKSLVTMKIDFNNTNFNNPSNSYSTGMVGPVEELCNLMKSQEELREFDMSGCQLDSTFYSTIFKNGLMNNHKLECLKLNNILNFSNSNMQDLAETLKTLNKLKEFELKNCSMAFDIFSNLIPCIEGQSELLCLKLDNNKITDIGDIPTKCKKMITISLVNNSLSKDTIQKMMDNISKDEDRNVPLIINVHNNNIKTLQDATDVNNKYLEVNLPRMSESKPAKFGFVI